MSDNSIIDDLRILGIHETPIKDLTINYVKISFFKLALVKHPDKAGDSSAAFQELLSSYHKILKHISEGLTGNNLDDDERFVKDIFNQCNLPKENKSSYTILIENNLADVWENKLSEIYSDSGKPSMSTMEMLLR